LLTAGQTGGGPWPRPERRSDVASRSHHHDDLDHPDQPLWSELDQAIGELLEHPDELFPRRGVTADERPGDETTEKAPLDTA
jgi:hypothetical protein